ncbi:cation:proton antiporter [Streptomyces sp. NPDC059816]|uniref:cation:proton antiporter n=1 Tax=Streptomyces sp. NPDC059816 TaxID=3346960 RepID=UPI00365FF562
MADLLVAGLHLIALLGVLALVAAVGRVVAGWLRLPLVIGEILVSLLVGPALLALVGRHRFDTLFPEQLADPLKAVGEIGLVLFLVGVVHGLDHGAADRGNRTLVRVTAGVFLLPLLTGLVFAGWVWWAGGPALLGTAPLPALVVMLTVAMSVTAVPVLACIIDERASGLGRSAPLALLSAILLDTVAWLLLAVALGLAAGGPWGVAGAFAALGAGALVTRWGRSVLGCPHVGAAAGRHPRAAAVVLAVIALAAAAGAREAGLTVVLGAFLTGVLLPKTQDGPWEGMTEPVVRLGRLLLPVFFVGTGITLFTESRATLPWAATLLCTALAVIGKVGGGYLGARWAGEDRVTALRVGVLVNTRGLTEIVVLQVGYAAGILTPGLFLAMLVMALATTGLTGPLLSLIDHRVARREPRTLQGGVQ